MAENKICEINISERKNIGISGVGEIISFDDRSVILQTALGTLHIDGNNLAIKHLDLETGLCEVSGEINGVFYLEIQKAKKRRKDIK